MTIPALPKPLPPVQHVAISFPETGKMVQPWQEYVLSLDKFIRGNAYPNFGGTAAADANAAGHALDAASFVSGVLLRTGPIGAFNDTTPTAAGIIAAIPSAIVGSSRLVFISNGGGGLLTMLAGSGVTLAGTTTISAGNTRAYLVTVTNINTGAEAVTVRGLFTATS